jgi:hypothetical protein
VVVMVDFHGSASSARIAHGAATAAAVVTAATHGQLGAWVE